MGNLNKKYYALVQIKLEEAQKEKLKILAAKKTMSEYLRQLIEIEYQLKTQASLFSAVPAVPSGFDTDDVQAPYGEKQLAEHAKRNDKTSSTHTKLTTLDDYDKTQQYLANLQGKKHGK